MIQKKSSFNRNKLALSVAALTLSSAVLAGDLFKIDIEKQNAGSALLKLSEKSGVQILMPKELGDNIQLPAIKGEFTVESALSSMLKDTGLTYKFASENSIVIQQQNSQSEETDNKEVEEVVVTGSRIRSDRQVSPVITIDRDQIERRGFSSAEDIIRSLPQNLSTMNATRSVQQPVGGDGLPVGPAAQGEFAANLRGIGQSATLVLIDGRRTSGSAAFSGSVVNLSTIPASAIERIEVLTDSAAAVYGSDAIAGVINVILRKGEGYSSATSTTKYENSVNGGNKYSFDQTFNYSWDSGSLMTIFSLSESKPILSEKAGYTTDNYNSKGGIDNRSTTYGQPGNFYFLGGSLPVDFDGTEAWTLADVSAANFQDARSSLIPTHQSSDTKDKSFYINLTQNLTDSVTAFANLRYSEYEVASVAQAPLIFATIDASNPFNTTGASQLVVYKAQYEHENGLIPQGFSQNTNESIHLESGLKIDLPYKDWQAEIVGTYSISDAETSGMSVSTYNSDFSPSEFALRVPFELNPFGNGTAQNLDLFWETFGPSPLQTDRKTRMKQLSANIEGSLIEMDSGDMRMAMGAEYRVEGLSFGATDYLAARDASDLTPSQSVLAINGELYIPLSDTLTAAIQGRYDEYEVDSSDSAIDGKSYSEFSPRIAVSWIATDDLTLRGSWGESFKAPNLTNLTVVETQGTFPSQVFDPIREETALVFRDNVGNPDLQSETGETVTVGVDWSPSRLEGFRTSVSYTKITFDNQIVGSLYGTGLNIEEILARPDLFPGVAVRENGDPNGALLRINSFPFNVAFLENETLDFDFAYQWATDAGEFEARLNGAYTLSQKQAAAESFHEIEQRASSSGPDRWNAVASLSWTTEQMGANFYANYVGSYRNTEAINATTYSLTPITEEERISHYITYDLTGYYNFGDGWKASAGVRNLLNNKFPFYHAFAGPWDSQRVDLRGRLIHLEIQKTFDF